MKLCDLCCSYTREDVKTNFHNAKRRYMKVLADNRKSGNAPVSIVHLIEPGIDNSVAHQRLDDMPLVTHGRQLDPKLYYATLPFTFLAIVTHVLYVLSNQVPTGLIFRLKRSTRQRRTRLSRTISISILHMSMAMASTPWSQRSRSRFSPLHVRRVERYHHSSSNSNMRNSCGWATTS